MTKALLAKKKEQAIDRATEVELQVLDTAHALSEEVLKYCVKELQTEGSTWNRLRRKLGLEPQEHSWRMLKDTLCSSVMPETEEEAFKAMQHNTQDMVVRIEGVLDQLHDRVRQAYGNKEEPAMFKVQLDAMKLHMEAHQKRFEHFLKMREMKLTDRQKHGASIIFQQNYFIPRPGQRDASGGVKFVDGKPVIDLEQNNQIEEGSQDGQIKSKSKKGNKVKKGKESSKASESEESCKED